MSRTRPLAVLTALLLLGPSLAVAAEKEMAKAKPAFVVK
jgi:hypothetical protein